MLIYLITNNINGKIYVGQIRQDLSKYFYNQGWRARRDVYKKPALYAAIRKYGIDNFSVRILRTCKSVDEMNVWEKIYITMFSCQEKQVGYNLSSGGDGFPDKIEPWNKGKKKPYSQETLVLMGASQKERFKREGSPSKGRVWTAEQKLAMSNLIKSRGIHPSREACIAGGKAATGESKRRWGNKFASRKT